MSTITKQRLYGTVSMLCVLSMVYFISQMIPLGMSGDEGGVKIYFTLMVAALLIGLTTGVAYYYIRYKTLSGGPDLERMRIEAMILANMAQKPTDTTQGASHTGPSTPNDAQSKK